MEDVTLSLSNLEGPGVLDVRHGASCCVPFLKSSQLAKVKESRLDLVLGITLREFFYLSLLPSIKHFDDNFNEWVGAHHEVLFE